MKKKKEKKENINGVNTLKINGWDIAHCVTVGLLTSSTIMVTTTPKEDMNSVPFSNWSDGVSPDTDDYIHFSDNSGEGKIKSFLSMDYVEDMGTDSAFIVRARFQKHDFFIEFEMDDALRGYEDAKKDAIHCTKAFALIMGKKTNFSHNILTD